ncbi:hypothetical protein BGZ68_003753 [Mortierella alpina]|nr:hypothetical protein BGZ68_003753 [Mortierella alpina]
MASSTAKNSKFVECSFERNEHQCTEDGSFSNNNYCQFHRSLYDSRRYAKNKVSTWITESDAETRAKRLIDEKCRHQSKARHFEKRNELLLSRIEKLEKEKVNLQAKADKLSKVKKRFSATEDPLVKLQKMMGALKIMIEEDEEAEEEEEEDEEDEDEDDE